MPELPEVETVIRSVAPKIEGRSILGTQRFSALVMPEDCTAALVGQTIHSVSRYGKHILMELDRGVLDVHLGMTGKLLTNGAETPYTRAILVLDRGRLLYDDIRQFGRIRYHERGEATDELGPDALTIGPAEFAERLAARRGRIKPLLLDQRFVRGLGNIYADEALFRAGVHPRARAARLSAHRAQSLHQAIVEVLTAAIEKGGSSISDYVDAEGRAGSFQVEHQVYGREGEPCIRCGRPIRRIVLAQRSAHYCPKCQRV